MFNLASPLQICAELGQRVRAVRLLRNLSQHELAQRVGTSLSSIRRLEAKGQASLELVVRVAQALQCVAGLEPLFVEEPLSIAALRAQHTQRLRARKAGAPATLKDTRRA